MGYNLITREYDTKELATHAPILAAFLGECAKPRATHQSSGKLRPSELGGCPRKTILRIQGREATNGGFSDVSIARMDLGVHYEDDTFKRLKAAYGQRITQDVAVSDDHWNGKIDFLLLPEDDKGRVRIIEHKGKGGSTFDYNKDLPEEKHMCQVLLYKYLYEKEHPGTECDVTLFYRGWSFFAEFDLVEFADGIRCTGWCKNDVVSRWKWLKPSTLRVELESWFDRGELPPLPQCASGKQGCLFRGEPACPYYNVCWGTE